MNITYCYEKCPIGKTASERFLQQNNSVLDAVTDFQFFTEECAKTCTEQSTPKEVSFMKYMIGKNDTGKTRALIKQSIDTDVPIFALYENVVGIDRGIRFLAVTYDSSGRTVFYNGNTVKQKRAHYKSLRKELQRIGTPSSRRRLKAIGQREYRWMQDVNHCVSKTLAESNPEGTLFVLEDLGGIRSAAEKVKVKDRYLFVSWPYYDLEQKLNYKALRNHQLVEKVNAAYTSQTCPKCGHTERTNRNKRIHLFCCKSCGYRSNDDRIGAMNLHRLGLELTVPDAVAAE